MLREGRDITEFYSAFGSHRETPLRHRNSNRLRKLNRQLENPHQNLSVVRSLFQILHFSFLRIPCDSYFSKCFVGTGDAGFSGSKGYTERERKTRWTQPGSICIGWQMTIIKNSEHARVTWWVVHMLWWMGDLYGLGVTLQIKWTNQLSVSTLACGRGSGS